MYFGRGDKEGDQIGFLGGSERAIFGRSYVAEPDVLIDELKKDEAIRAAADPSNRHSLRHTARPPFCPPIHDGRP
jgi:hypothetical protein